jgi:hypothetical protein
MSIDLLQQFLGGDSQRQQEYSDFAQRYSNNPHSVSNEEAAQRYQEIIRHAPPELVEQAFDYAFRQLPLNDREALAAQLRAASQDSSRPFDGYSYRSERQAATPQNLKRMLSQASQQDPDLLGKLFGPDSPLNTPLGRMLLSAVITYLVNRMLGNQQQGGAPASQQQQPGGGLGDIFGKILGGQGQGGQQEPAGGLGGLIGAILGGQQSAGGLGAQQPAGGLGDIIGAILGGQAQGSMPGGQPQGRGAGNPQQQQEPQGDVLGSLRKDDERQRGLTDK